MNQNKILSLIGLATKAGRTVSGEFSTEKEVKSGRAALVIVAMMRLITRRKNSKTCVTFITCQSIFIKIKIPWGMQWENSSGRPLRYWMRDLQKESGSIWIQKRTQLHRGGS